MVQSRINAQLLQTVPILFSLFAIAKIIIILLCTNKKESALGDTLFTMNCLLEDNHNYVKVN